MSKIAIEPGSFDKLCRLCLGSKRSLVDIYPVKKKAGTVAMDQKIITCTSLIMYQGDGLPEKICSKCVQAVNMSFSMRTLAIKSDAQLREILEQQQQQQQEETSTEVTPNRLEEKVCKIEFVAANEDVNGQSQIKDEIFIEFNDEDGCPTIIMDQPDAEITVAHEMEVVEEEEEEEEEREDSIKDNIVMYDNSEEIDENPQSPQSKAPRFSAAAAHLALALLSKQAGLTITKRNSQKSKLKRSKSESKDDDETNEILARRNLISQKIKELGKKMEGDKYYCQECKIFIGNAYFYNHVKFVHVKVRDHLCEDCGYRAQTGHILRQHIDAVHTDHTYPCDYCERTFRSMKSARDHMRSVHLQAKERGHICQFCGKGFFTAYYLRNHIRTHTMETPYKCQYCDRRFSFKWPCTTHERLHTGVKPYKCSFCPEAFTQNCVRKNHEYRAHGNEEFNPKNRKPREGNLREKKKGKLKIVPTDVLANTSEDQNDGQSETGIIEYLEEDYLSDSAAEHEEDTVEQDGSEEILAISYLPCEIFKAVKKSQETQNTVWPLTAPAIKSSTKGKKTCDLCDFVACGKGSLARHMRIMHRNGGQTHCTACNKFVWTRLMDQHNQDVHCDAAGPCDHCGSVVPLLRAHTREAHPEILKLCPYCLLDVGGDVYDDHVNQTHSDTYYCEVCNREFFDVACWRNHVKLTHVRDKMYVCTECSFSTPYRSSMDKHMLSTHVRNERFVCEFCAKVFAMKDNLSKHIRHTHRGEGRVACIICGKAFCANRELTNHMRLHTGDLPFQCDFCSRRFPKKSSWEAHRRIHTGEKHYQCGHCTEAFRTALQMKVHGFREHGIEEYRNADRSLFAKKLPKLS